MTVATPLPRGALRATGVLGALATISIATGAALHLYGMTVWAVVAVISSGVLIATTFRGAGRLAGLCAGAMILGAVGQLAITQPIWFQTVQIKPRGAYAPYYMLIASQVVATAYILAGRWRGLWARLCVEFGAGGLALCAALLALSTVAIMSPIATHDHASFVTQSIVQCGLAALNAATTVALVAVLPATDWSAVGRFAARPSFTWVIAGFVLLVTALLALTAFDRMPRLPDEVAYLFQAKYFAAGRLFLPAPPAAAAPGLQYDWISIFNGRWYSIFPPGWPALLAVGVAIGVPFLVNPILSALAVLLADRLLRRLGAERIAPLALLLLASSPWFLAMGASLMSHVLTVVLMLGGWLLLTRRGRAMIPAAFVGGLLMGWLFLTRPLEGIVVGGVAGLWLIADLDLRRPASWGAIVAYGIGCIAVGALIFAYNMKLTGNPMLTPIDEYFNRLWHPGANRLGFGADIGPPDSWEGIDIWLGHSPLEALVGAQYNLMALNTELLGWRAGSLVLAFAHMIWGKRRPLDWWMVAIIGGIMVAYALYWFNGAFYIGPRYWFMMLVPLIYLSARGLVTLVDRLQRTGMADAAGRVGAASVLLVFISLTVFLPWRGVARYWEFRNFHADFRRVEPSLRGTAPLVFVRAGDMSDYGSAFMLNRVGLDGPLFVQTQGAAGDRAVSLAFPGRPVITMEGRLGKPSRRAKVVPPEIFYREQR